jgi:hypothetical protein
MDAHLNGATLDGYLARTFDTAELRRLDEHVAGCLRCALVVEGASFEADRWERKGLFGRLTRVPPLPDAQRVERAA